MFSLSLGVLCSLAAANLDYSRVHLVYHNTRHNTWFFRGNMPANASMFQYDDLQAALAARATEAGYKLPTLNYLVDVTLNNPFDGTDYYHELEFWANPLNALKGEIVHWPLVGNVVSPGDVAETERHALIDNGTIWEVDHIPKRIAQLNQWLDFPTNVTLPHVYYVHCSAGCDRTGELVGSYRIKYMLPTVPFTNASGMFWLDTTECGRSPNYYSTTALMWYCFTYQYLEPQTPPAGNCLGFAKCQIFGDCHPLVNVTSALL